MVSLPGPGVLYFLAALVDVKMDNKKRGLMGYTPSVSLSLTTTAGFQARYQKTNQVFIFFTDDALNKFSSGEGWTVGAEAGLTLVEVGTGVSAITLRNQGAVAAFAFGSEGLMGGWSAKGTKFSRIEPGR